MIKELYDFLIANKIDDKTAKRFADKVNATNDGCWLWQANVSQGGYGRFQWKGKAMYAHRWIFQQLYGDAGSSIDHICVQAACVNPKHLQIVTRGQNTLLMFQRGPTSHSRSPIMHSGSRLFSIRRAIETGQFAKVPSMRSATATYKRRMR